jgi:D-sedoheptulose 7-phosphate isomerase
MALIIMAVRRGSALGMRRRREESLKEAVLNLALESLRVKERFFQENADAIGEIARLIQGVFRRGNKILIFGNGGSAADAQHIAAEFVNRFLFDRAPLPAIALTTDTSVVTSISNDADFSLIFSRQIEALGRKGDIAWGITTSGRSPNVLEGLRKAKAIGMETIAFTGNDGGEALRMADYGLNVNSTSTPRIQETHITVCHIICELVERELFPTGVDNEAEI